MTAPVRIPAKLFQRAIACLEHLGLPIAHELRACLPRPSEKKRDNRKRNAAAKGTARAEKNAETSEIRESVFARAGEGCEYVTAIDGEPCGKWASDLHHVLGRKEVAQSASNTVALCRSHHDALTTNADGAESCWLAMERTIQRLKKRAGSVDARTQFVLTQMRIRARLLKHRTKAKFLGAQIPHSRRSESP